MYILTALVERSSRGQSRLLVAWALVGLLVVGSGCQRGSSEPASSSGNGDATGSGAGVATSSLPSDDDVKKLLDESLEFTCEGRRLNLTDHGAWQIVHGALAFGRDFKVTNLEGADVSAIDHLLGGGQMIGWNMREGVMLGDPPRPGLRAIVEAGSKTGQGHADQWLGYMADIGLKLDQEIKASGRSYTLEDYLRQIEYDVPYNVEQEYSWTLMALTMYRPTSYEWTAGDGNRWSIERLLEIEVNHDLGASACGGSHRMAGIVMALNQHRKAGGKVEGAWKAADDKVKQCVATARQYQNPDGSLSTNWFQRPGASPDIRERIGCTGHVLEFVVLASDDEQLKEAWIKRAAVYLCQLLNKTRSIELECGALYHAAHGLVLYRQRMYGARSYVESSDDRT